MVRRPTSADTCCRHYLAAAGTHAAAEAMRLTRKELLLAAFALLLVGAVAWVWLSPTGLTQAPAIALTTIEGKRIELTGLRGKPVLVNFWATTCPSCVKEMPELMALHRDLATQGFTVIG